MAAPVPGDEHTVEFVVWTNSDIHLQPPFYRVLAELIHQGYDAITVNRRTIDIDRRARSFSPLFMADSGAEHPGFDCFVFPAAMFRSFVRSRACCGAAEVMRSLLFNIVANARRFLMLTTPHMTFHLGNDQPWCESPVRRLWAIQLRGGPCGHRGHGQRCQEGQARGGLHLWQEGNYTVRAVYYARSSQRKRGCGGEAQAGRSA